MNDTEKNATSQPWRIGGQKVLVLVGLIGSGKSTFAKALEAHIPEFRRCNQDDLGNRRAVEKLARESLRDGLSICVDRTNVDETQRAHWINIARERVGTQVWCLVFDTPLNICADRLEHRTNHPTIKTPEQGKMVLHRFASDLRPPILDEGFDRILHITPAEHPTSTYTKDDIVTILLRIQTSAPPPSSHQGHDLSSLNQTNLDHYLGADRRFRGGHGQRGTFRARGFRGSGNVRSFRPRGSPWASSSSSGYYFHDEDTSSRLLGVSGPIPASNSGEIARQPPLLNRDPLENDEQMVSPRDVDSSQEHAVSDAQPGAKEALEQGAEYGTAEKPIILD